MRQNLHIPFHSEYTLEQTIIENIHVEGNFFASHVYRKPKS
jgi:hypothetical protein